MSVVLKIDNRERYAKDIFTVPAVYENLEYGDFVFEINDQVHVVIERKTLPDLAASIKDGRYTNQKKSLLDKYDPSKIYYIIEGTVNYCEQGINISGISYSALLSAIINTSVRDKIHVFVTKNTLETCGLIEMLYNRMSKDPQKYSCNCTVLSKDDVIRKEKVTSPKDCLIAQLCQVPGVSNKTAQTIASSYNNIAEFVQEIVLKRDETFTNMKIESSSGKLRAISSSAVKNILEYMA
jgi:ERCC4-type nuclease|uniref:ERCC4 domain-containing protein n=1 Tax=viral metagenome TaxID=1070528 RepID=A0A6C0BEZ5_9ZZZZ